MKNNYVQVRTKRASLSGATGQNFESTRMLKPTASVLNLATEG